MSDHEKVSLAEIDRLLNHAQDDIIASVQATARGEDDPPHELLPSIEEKIYHCSDIPKEDRERLVQLVKECLDKLGLQAAAGNTAKQPLYALMQQLPAKDAPKGDESFRTKHNGISLVDPSGK